MIEIAFFINRYSKRACIIAARNDQLLIATGAKKRSFGWFTKMGICNSYNSTALKRNSEMAVDHDKNIVILKQAHEEDFKAMKDISEANNISMDEAEKLRRETHPPPKRYKVHVETSEFLF